MTLAAMNSGLQTLANHQGVNSAGAPPETPAHKKLRKAAQDFEGILISQLLGDFKMGSSSLTGDAPLAGSDTLNSLAIQTLSAALASRGGLGIGQMLVHQLESSLNRGQQNQGGGKIKTVSGG
jgi:Rod binding domain-containing protein